MLHAECSRILVIGAQVAFMSGHDHELNVYRAQSLYNKLIAPNGRHVINIKTAGI